MTTALTSSNIQKIEELLVTGNLAQLTSKERVEYVNKVCETMGLNPLTRPFDFMTFQGKMVMYAKKDCTDQLRKIHNVSIKVVKQEIINDLLFFTVEASDRNGRVDSDIGVINIANLKGDALANASMKGLTKAKRRVTLSFCGLGILDESEIDSMTYSNSSSENTPYVEPAKEEIPLDEKTFKNIRDLLAAKKRTEIGLLNYISEQFKLPEPLCSIEEMNQDMVNSAYKILGGKA